MKKHACKSNYYGRKCRIELNGGIRDPVIPSKTLEYDHHSSYSLFSRYYGINYSIETFECDDKSEPEPLSVLYQISDEFAVMHTIHPSGVEPRICEIPSTMPAYLSEVIKTNPEHAGSFRIQLTDDTDWSNVIKYKSSDKVKILRYACTHAYMQVMTVNNSITKVFMYPCINLRIVNYFDNKSKWSSMFEYWLTKHARNVWLVKYTMWFYAQYDMIKLSKMARKCEFLIQLIDKHEFRCGHFEIQMIYLHLQMSHNIILLILASSLSDTGSLNELYKHLEGVMMEHETYIQRHRCIKEYEY